MRLLEHRADIDHGVDIGARGRVPSDGRFRTLGRKSHSERTAELAAAGSPLPAKTKIRKRPSALTDVAKMNRLGVREPNDRRGVKARADHQALGEMLMVGFGGEERRAVVRRRSRGIVAVPDEIVLGLGRVRALVVCPWRRRGSRPIRGRSRSAPWLPPAVPTSSCAGDAARCAAAGRRRASIRD